MVTTRPKSKSDKIIERQKIKERVNLHRSWESQAKREERLLKQSQRQALYTKEQTKNKKEKTKAYQKEYQKKYREIKKLQPKPRKEKRAEFPANVEKYSLGLLNIKCEDCQAYHFKCENNNINQNSFYTCCKYGRVILDNLPPLSSVLQNLFKGTHPKSKEFYKHIRQYNTSLSFASIFVKMKNTFQGKGPYCYRIVGDMLHRLNLALHPDDEQDPTFGQLYIFDPEEANNIRMNMSSYQDCDGDLLRLLEEEIRSVNIYAKSYNMIIDEEKKQENLFNAQRKQNSNLYLLFGIYKDKLKKNKRYEFPQENSVAAVFAIGPDGEVPEAQIVIHQKGKEINTLKSTNPHVEGLTYPLFFPEGLEGWITDMKANNKHISRQDVT